jgi:hypothetical protein
MTEALWARAGNHPIRKKHHGQIMPILTLIPEPLRKNLGPFLSVSGYRQTDCSERSERIGVGHEIASHRSIPASGPPVVFMSLTVKFSFRMINITQGLLKDQWYCLGLASLAGLVCDRKVDTASDGGDRRSIEI